MSTDGCKIKRPTEFSMQKKMFLDSYEKTIFDFRVTSLVDSLTSFTQKKF